MAGARNRRTQPLAQKLLGKVPWWWAGLSKYGMGSAQESQNETLGMRRSHWSVAFCLWDARLVQQGCAFGTGSSNTSRETKTQRRPGGAQGPTVSQQKFPETPWPLGITESGAHTIFEVWLRNLNKIWVPDLVNVLPSSQSCCLIFCPLGLFF